MLTSADIKEFAKSCGAVACGISGIDRFTGAPEGFKPTDIYSKAKSVVVVLKKLPEGSIFSENPVPYTHAAYKLYEEVDRISMELLRLCESENVGAVIIPADVPYIYWDNENKVGRGILSLKHAAVNAGLGIMGRSTIFISREHGNLVYIGAILVDAELEPDALCKDLSCPSGCNVCRKSCPVGAINDAGVNQKLCRANSFYLAGRGWDLYACNACRRLCPMLKIS